MKTFKQTLAGLISLFLLTGLALPISGWAAPVVQNPSKPVAIKQITTKSMPATETTLPVRNVLFKIGQVSTHGQPFIKWALKVDYMGNVTLKSADVTGKFVKFTKGTISKINSGQYQLTFDLGYGKLGLPILKVDLTISGKKAVINRIIKEQLWSTQEIWHEEIKVDNNNFIISTEVSVDRNPRRPKNKGLNILSHNTVNGVTRLTSDRLEVWSLDSQSGSYVLKEINSDSKYTYHGRARKLRSIVRESLNNRITSIQIIEASSRSWTLELYIHGKDVWLSGRSNDKSFYPSIPIKSEKAEAIKNKILTLIHGGKTITFKDFQEILSFAKQP